MMDLIHDDYYGLVCRVCEKPPLNCTCCPLHIRTLKCLTAEDADNCYWWDDGCRFDDRNWIRWGDKPIKPHYYEEKV